ncbi:DUF2569 domain-containing protein [Paenibacillus nasutitermitis]|uniref:DUF2569 domain-containing protein n=1 Tax=Paenibacillus nasutitermitis TaxID=1652958 RepID=A0A916YPK0_9BACL|nr:DUF2569 domain-containing protein [Paenibacillus nasutitermitis]GGD55637.1 hypothetical protein GCM10010911_11710 [Paenibacillus nasutitermitis]
MQTEFRNKPNDLKLSGPEGLGGWLVLVQIGLYFTVLNLINQLFRYTIPAFAPDTWELLTDKDSSVYHWLWAPSLIFEALYNILLLLFSIFILVCFYRKKTILPVLMICFYSTGLIVVILDYILLNQIPALKEVQDTGSTKVIIRSVISCAIWIPYFLKSNRVSRTFVR